MTDETKPCDIPCPKCGNADIMRAYLARGSRFKSVEYDRAGNKYAHAVGWSSTSERDHIHNHCRCCQYTWQTLPMPKRRKPKETK